MSNQVIEVKLQEASKSWVDHAKLGVDLLGPLVAAIFGIWVIKLTKRIEQNQWRNQKLIEKRISIWDDVGPPVNDIYCFCKRIGSWKEMTPNHIISQKRKADKAVHLARPYFSRNFFRSYIDFTNSSFAMYQDHGADAKIRSSSWEHRNAREEGWEGDWDVLLTDEFDEGVLDSTYERMLCQVQDELASN